MKYLLIRDKRTECFSNSKKCPLTLTLTHSVNSVHCMQLIHVFKREELEARGPYQHLPPIRNYNEHTAANHVWLYGKSAWEEHFVLWTVWLTYMFCLHFGPPTSASYINCMSVWVLFELHLSNTRKDEFSPSEYKSGSINRNRRISARLI